MRRMLLFLVLTVAGMGIYPIKAAEHVDAGLTEKTKNEILKVEEELIQAISKDDANTLDRIFADEIVWLTSTGQFLTKAEVLANIHSRNLTGFSIKSDEKELHVYGDTAVVYSKTANKSETEPRTITDVFVKRDGKWKLVAHGATVIAQ
jgi:ketosteroid isomerase-like protein